MARASLEGGLLKLWDISVDDRNFAQKKVNEILDYSIGTISVIDEILFDHSVVGAFLNHFDADSAEKAKPNLGSLSVMMGQSWWLRLPTKQYSAYKIYNLSHLLIPYFVERRLSTLNKDSLSLFRCFSDYLFEEGEVITTVSKESTYLNFSVDNCPFCLHNIKGCGIWYGIISEMIQWFNNNHFGDESLSVTLNGPNVINSPHTLTINTIESGSDL